MSIWCGSITLSELNLKGLVGISKHLGIQFTDIGSDYLNAKMPVDERTMQPAKILHGGASVVLAETLGSVGAFGVIDRNLYKAVGQEINANHIRSVNRGWVYGTAKPLHIGKTTHVWTISITDENQKLISVSRMTVAILDISLNK